jgi:hypothetical protein
MPHAGTLTRKRLHIVHFPDLPLLSNPSQNTVFDGFRIGASPMREKILFGQRLRELRRERAMSQEAFTDHCVYVRSYMSRLKRGAGKSSLYAIEVLASALDMEVQALFMPGASR